MLSVIPDIEEIRAIISEYRAIVYSMMQLIADRYDQNVDYHWIDTKLSVITGRDFPEDDALRSKSTIYAWIQGRGLESLTLHHNWLMEDSPEEKTRTLISRLERIIKEVSESCLKAGELNGGHFFFFMDSRGKAIEPEAGGTWSGKNMDSGDPWNISDIFVSRGLFASSLISGNEEVRSFSISMIMNIFKGIRENRFITDQHPLAEGNPVTAVRGRLSHTPWMLMIGSMTLLLKHGVSEALEPGITAIRYILDHHVNINNKWKQLKDYDYIEYIGTGNELWYTGEKVLSDPGHAVEFIGLTLQFVFLAESLNQHNKIFRDELAEIASMMYPIFRRNFINGYNRETEGIVKLIDLESRQTVNGLMPWWSLPEAMRAALGCSRIAQNNEERTFCMEAYSLCHNSFINNYLVNEYPGMQAVQTRDEQGRIIDSISAVPDADPGYHTGLSLIDCMDMIDAASTEKKGLQQ